MPIGCDSVVPHVARLLRQHRVRSVLDLGIGMGFYGAVVRQWLDAGVKPWRTRLVGIEAWAPYRNPCWDLYDAVEVRTIEDYLASTTERFDAVLLLDTLEHFDRNEGQAVIHGCHARLNQGGVLVIATPGVEQVQGPAHGNELERHRSFWTAADLTAIGFSIAADGSVDAFGHKMVIGSRSVASATRPPP